jgi:hypothetical protein
LLEAELPKDTEKLTDAQKEELMKQKGKQMLR